MDAPKQTKHRYRKRSGFPKQLEPYCDEILRRKAMFQSDEEIIAWLKEQGLPAEHLFDKLHIFPAGIEAAGEEIAAALPISHPYWVLKQLNDIVDAAESNSERLTALRLAYTISSKTKPDGAEEIDYNEDGGE